MTSQSPADILNSTFLKEGKEAFENKRYKVAEKKYRQVMEYALQHEEEVGIYLVFRSINSVGAALSAQKKPKESKKLHHEAEKYLYGKINGRLDGHLINLFDLVDYLSRHKIQKIDVVNPYVSGKAVEINGGASEEDYRKMEEFIRKDDVLKGIKKPTKKEIQDILSVVPPRELSDITRSLYDIACNKDNLVCKSLDEYEKYYRLLLKFPLPAESHQLLNDRLFMLRFLGMGM